MKPQRETSDGIGPVRLRGYFFFFSRSWERRTAPVSDVCWMVHQDSQNSRPENNQFDRIRLSTASEVEPKSSRNEELVNTTTASSKDNNDDVTLTDKEAV